MKPIPYEKAGGRRFLLTIGINAMTAALLWFEKLSGTDYVTVVVATAATYIAGNVMQKVQAPETVPQGETHDSDPNDAAPAALEASRPGRAGRRALVDRHEMDGKP